MKNLALTLLVLAVTALGTGCGSSEKKAELKTDQVNFERFSSSGLNQPQSLDPNGADAFRWGNNAETDSGENLMGLSLGSIYLPYLIYANVRNIVKTGNVEGKDYDKQLSQELLGRCTYRDTVNLAISSPCSRVQVLLKEDKKSESAVSTWTNQEGRFRFFIPKDKKYFITVLDSKGRTSELPTQVGGGQIVDLVLKP